MNTNEYPLREPTCGDAGVPGTALPPSGHAKAEKKTSSERLPEDEFMRRPFDPAKPCMTRNGRSVRILATDLPQPCSIAAYIDSPANALRCFYPNGRYQAVGNCATDLINVPEKIRRKVWLNVYPGGVRAFTSLAVANLPASNDRIACLELDLMFECGQGL